MLDMCGTSLVLLGWLVLGVPVGTSGVHTQTIQTVQAFCARPNHAITRADSFLGAIICLKERV